MDPNRRTVIRAITRGIAIIRAIMELGKLSRQTNKLWPPATAAYSSPAPRHRENPDWNGRGRRETVGEGGFTNRGKAYDLEARIGG